MTFSQHVHIGIPNKKYFIPVLNSLRKWIGPLLAISTNSPFFFFFNTGMLSSRTFQFSVFPRTNIPNYIKDYTSFIDICDKYKKMNSILYPRHIWWKIRPHLDFGTIEFRICDAQRSLQNVSLIAAISQALVYQSVKDYDNNKLKEKYNYELLNDCLWKSSRFNFDVQVYEESADEIISLRKMILLMEDYVGEALYVYNNESVLNYLKNILDYGAESSKQLEIYNKSGFKKLNKYLIENVSYSIGDK